MSASTLRNERLLVELSKLPGNDICADCRSPAPRWCSWNLGIFLCVNCASVHRKMGTHISRVKSLTLDMFTREQVDTLRDVGNVKSNLKINNDDSRNPPPTNLEHSERDNELERYIRRKYDPSLSRSSIVQAAFRRNPAQSSPVPPASSLPLHATHPSSRAHQNDADKSVPPPLPIRTPSQASSSSLPSTNPTKAPVFGSMLEHRPANGQGVGHPGGVEPMRRGRVAPTQGTMPSSTIQPLQNAVPSTPQQQQPSHQIQPPLQYATQPSFQYTASQQGNQYSSLQPLSSPQNPQLQQQQLSFQAQSPSVPLQSPYQSSGGWFDPRSVGNGSTEVFSNQYTQSQPTPSLSSAIGSMPTGGSYGTQGSFPTGMESAQYPNFQQQQQQQQQIQAQQSAYGSFGPSNTFPSFQQQQPGPSSISSYSLPNGMNGISMMSQSGGLNQTQSHSQGQFANGSSGQSTLMMGPGQMQMQMQGQAQGQGFDTQNGFMMGMMPSRPGAGWHA